METNEQGKAEKGFKNFGKKVDVFVNEFQEATEKLEREFQQKLDELKIAAENLKKEAENKERWQEVEASLKKATDEVANAFKAAFKKKENP
jgi:C4-dicarboxylate-specific signal transduction histidine kinase